MFLQVKNIFTNCSLVCEATWLDKASFVSKLSVYFALSWIFALGAQVVIPLPFNLVPLVINPFPLLLAVHLIGKHAIYAYVIYLVQGACGLPFFLGFKSGILYLLGPTGGYSIGFLVAMSFFAIVRSVFPKSRLFLLIKLLCCSAIYFSCGLAQLSLFVPIAQLFNAGLYPFVLGDACKLLAIVIFF